MPAPNNQSRAVLTAAEGRIPFRNTIQPAAVAAKAAAEESKPITDIRGSAGYRREVTEVLARRAFEGAAARDLGDVVLVDIVDGLAAGEGEFDAEGGADRAAQAFLPMDTPGLSIPANGNARIVHCKQ